MKNKFNKIMVFGDSYQFGEELAQSIIPDLKEKAEDIVGAKIQTDGCFNTKDLGFKQRKLINNLVNNELQDQVGPMGNSLCIGGRIAAHYNLKDYQNLAKGGLSMDAIFTRLFENIHLIDKNTFVIVGLTYTQRNSRFTTKVGTDDAIRCYNNHHNMADSEHHLNYMLLNEEYGDDLLIQYINLFSQIVAITHLLTAQQCQFIIVDPLNLYLESPELDNKFRKGWKFSDNMRRRLENHEQWEALHHVDLIRHLQDEMNSHLFKYTLIHSLVETAKSNSETYCLMGHPNARCHQHFADNYLIPYIASIVEDKT